jgi:hypothetical protein
MYAQPRTPKDAVDAKSATYWTVAYRNPRAEL